MIAAPMVTTQNSGRIVVLLYEGAISSLEKAIKVLESKDYGAKGRYISKAYDIIFELNIVLDMEAGGELSENLRNLYTFMCTHLSKANSKCDSAKIRDVIGILQELSSGFKAIAV